MTALASDSLSYFYKSVRNRRVIEVLVAFFVLSCWVFSCGCGAFVIGLSQISSFFSFNMYTKTEIKRVPAEIGNDHLLITRFTTIGTVGAPCATCAHPSPSPRHLIVKVLPLYRVNMVSPCSHKALLKTCTFIVNKLSC